MARLIFHRKFRYAGMTREIVIRIDGETRLKLGSGDRAAVILSAGPHLIEASLGKDNSCGVDLVVDEHDEVNFACLVVNFFQPAPVLELVGKGAIRQRFELDRKGARERANDHVAIEMWTGVLGVRPDATLDEIHHAYIRQMRLYHPDLPANQSESLREVAAWKAREINMAYSVARKHLRGR